MQGFFSISVCAMFTKATFNRLTYSNYRKASLSNAEYCIKSAIVSYKSIYKHFHVSLILKKQEQKYPQTKNANIKKIEHTKDWFEYKYPKFITRYLIL